MNKTWMKRSIAIGLLLGMFSLGFLVGSVQRNRAEAQNLKDLGAAAMEKAGESGGAMGSAVQLGTSIVDMQKHVDGLQKNLEALKKVKEALGG